MVQKGFRPGRDRLPSGRKIAYYGCCELKLIADLLYQGGITEDADLRVETAQYGDYVSGPRIVDDATKETHEGAVLKDIRTARS